MGFPDDDAPLIDAPKSGSFVEMIVEPRVRDVVIALVVPLCPGSSVGLR